MSSSGQGWTAASVAVKGDGMAVSELEEIFGRSTEDVNRRLWAVDVCKPGDQHIDTVLDSVQEYVERNLHSFATLGSECEIEVRIGWTPTSGIAGVGFNNELIKLLGRINAHLALDVYEREIDEA